MEMFGALQGRRTVYAGLTKTKVQTWGHVHIEGTYRPVSRCLAQPGVAYWVFKWHRGVSYRLWLHRQYSVDQSFVGIDVFFKYSKPYSHTTLQETSHFIQPRENGCNHLGLLCNLIMQLNCSIWNLNLGTAPIGNFAITSFHWRRRHVTSWKPDLGCWSWQKIYMFPLHPHSVTSHT